MAIDTRHAVAAAQMLMKSFDQKLLADGVWGDYTQGVYKRVPAESRRYIDMALSSAGVTADALTEARHAQKREAQSVIANARGIRDAIHAASLESGLPFDLLSGVAWIESKFNPKAANGKSRGLMQMQPAAWADAMVQQPNLPSYESVFDATANARAGAAYLRVLIRRLKTLGLEGQPSPAQLYLAHQQGAHGFMELHRAAQGLPSLKSYVTPEAMKRNPPQDGQGATTDKGSFYRRWLAVADRVIRQAPSPNN